MKVTKWMKILDESWTSMDFLDNNYKLTNYLDEKFDMLKCMDGINSKTIMLDENHIYMDESYKRMKYLDERGTWMNFWMIIKNKWNFWMKLSMVECMDESNSKTVMTNGNYQIHIIFISNFIYKKKVSKVKFERATLQCKKVKQ